jgi:hypothetical protein
MYALKPHIHVCVGTALETKSVAQTVIETAPDRSKTLAFNYASQALNNSFFLDFLVRRRLAPVTTPYLFSPRNHRRLKLSVMRAKCHKSSVPQSATTLAL